VYDVVTGTTDYASAADVADAADCSTDGARDALSQLVEMGIAEQREGRPVTYRRNESYFRWRRVEELAREHTAAELREEVDALLTEDRALQERFGVADPDAVTPTAFETADHDEVHDRWEALTRWRTVRRDVALLQRAAHRAGGDERDGADDAVRA
jgi:predicted ArsR family transcriptional regulator